MSVKDFKLPDLGEGLTEGTILEWKVAVGDVIELNAVVATVETAKAAVDVPSPFAGTIVETIGEEGEELEVGTVFVRIDTAGGAAPATGGDDAAEHVQAEEGTPAGDPVEDGKPKSTGLDADEEPQPLVGYGNKGGGGSRRRRKKDAGGNGAAPAAAATQAVESFENDNPLAKPPVRKLAKDLGVDLTTVRPTGEGGVITREDVRAAAEGASAPAASAPANAPATAAPAPAAASAPAPAAMPELAAPAGGGEKAVPGFRGKAPGQVEQIAGIRKRIVAKMEQSRTEIPEASTSYEADVTALWELRKQLTEAAKEDGFDVKITPFALVLRATVMALRRFPTLNARIDTDAGEITYLESINLGFAADTDRGLVVPNIKDAQSKSVLQLAMELNDLATQARDGRIGPGALTGGTFTVSNYGAFGNVDGVPVINHPEGAILGVGAMNERPWVVDGELAVRRVCKLWVSFDHRISDGGEGGRFVTYLGQLLENPARILLHA